MSRGLTSLISCRPLSLAPITGNFANWLRRLCSCSDVTYLLHEHVSPTTITFALPAVTSQHRLASRTLSSASVNNLDIHVYPQQTRDVRPIIWIYMYTPSKHETFAQFWYNVGPASMERYCGHIVWTSRVCWTLKVTHSPNTRLMLIQRRRRWTNIKRTLGRSWMCNVCGIFVLF